MDKPLTRWYCDVCGEPIDNLSKGYVIWRNDENLRSHDFKIIHKSKCDLKHYLLSGPLENFLGEKGLAYLLAHLSLGPLKKTFGEGPHCDAADLDEMVDLIRRCQTPYYEEARRYFGHPDLLSEFSDANEVLPYLPEILKQLIERYGKTE